MIFLACSCGRRFKTEDKNSGRRTRCPVCGKPLVVPERRADAGPVGKSGEPSAPPSWWYPKGNSEASKVSAPLGFETGEDEGPIASRSASPGTAVSSRSAKSPNKLAVAAGVGGVAILVLGLLLWVAHPGSTSDRGTKTEPVSADNGVSESLVKAAPKAGTAGPRAAAAPSDNNPHSSVAASPGRPTKPAASSEAASTQSSKATPTTASAEGQPRLQLLVPAYFYPAGPGLKDWERLIDAAARVPIVVVANPASGPGEAANPDYSAVVGRAVRRGVTVVGYVNTNYARRPRLEVEADVDRWVEFCPKIRGIFFDAQAGDAGYADYYAELRDFVRKKIKRAVVITNPGTLCAEEYAARPVSDVFCVFESPSGFDDFRLPAWADRHSAGHFAALPYNVANPEEMRDCIQVAPSRGMGFVYVTDGKLPNPWDRLPSYWDAEVEAVSKVNQGAPP